MCVGHSGGHRVGSWGARETKAAGGWYLSTPPSLGLRPLQIRSFLNAPQGRARSTGGSEVLGLSPRSVLKGKWKKGCMLSTYCVLEVPCPMGEWHSFASLSISLLTVG